MDDEEATRLRFVGEMLQISRETPWAVVVECPPLTMSAYLL